MKAPGERTITRHTSNGRLLKLAGFLDRLPSNRFNFRVWVGPGWKGSQDLSCGTTGCALAWAATMPAFRRLGLYLTSSGDAGHVALSGVTVAGASTSSLFAAQAVFGLLPWEASRLFIPGEFGLPMDATPQQVAVHIREFVIQRGQGGGAA